MNIIVLLNIINERLINRIILSIKSIIMYFVLKYKYECEIIINISIKNKITLSRISNCIKVLIRIF